MSEDDRAAKAARAKALLKKRQAAQKVGVKSASGFDSPTRTDSPGPFSPAIPDAPGTPPPQPAYAPAPPANDLADLFTQSASTNDGSWLSSLERVPSPPAPAPPPAAHSPAPTSARSPSPAAPIRAPVPMAPPSRPMTPPPPRSYSPAVKSPLSPPIQPHANGNGAAYFEDLRPQVQQLQQVIAALTSEKAALSSSLQQLSDVQRAHEEAEGSLRKERELVASLQNNISTLTQDRDALSASLDQLRELESASAQTQSLLDAERFKTASLEESLFSLEAENEELAVKAQRLGQVEPMLQKAGNLLREEQARASSLDERVHELEEQVREIPRQLQTIAALEADKSDILERLHATQTHARETEDVLNNERAESEALRQDIVALQAEARDASALQDTISLLVSEKSNLTAQLERFRDLEARSSEVQASLNAERQRADTLDGRVREMEVEASAVSAEIARLSVNEKELADRCREQERELQLTKAALGDAQVEAGTASRRVRELEDQMQNDDTVQRLEATIKHSQDRADELEFQLTKMKEAHNTLKTERETLEAQLREHSTAAEEWVQKHGSLGSQNKALQEQLAATAAERDLLQQDKLALQTETAAAQKAAEDLQTRLAQAANDLGGNARQLQNAQAELRAALRRAEEAERMQKDLQGEGMSLMRALEEMRPKVVELTNEKADLSDRAESLTRQLSGRDTVISQLETALAEAQQQRDEVEKLRKQTDHAYARERAAAQDTLADLQKAYADLQSEADAAYADIRESEMQRRAEQQAMVRNAEDVERLTKTVREQEAQLAALQAELAEGSSAAEEQADFLGRIQTEIEFLRGEIATRDDEIARLQSVAPPVLEGSGSWNDEMMGATKQLELSEAQSKIRGLETAVFEAEDRAHALQKQVASLQDQLAHSILVHARSASQEGRRPFSPTGGMPSRPSSRNHRDDGRRSSLGSPSLRKVALAPPARTALDYNMSPETQHKRQISLSMLKARMDREAVGPVSSHPGSRAISPMPPNGKANGLAPVAETNPSHSFRKSQFMDESHVFWCHACTGDLMVL